MAKTLSVFIDESGDFGEVSKHSPYYLVSLVLHDQDKDISNDIAELDWHVINLGYPKHAIHTGPLIRKELVYINDTREDRRKLFNALFHFSRHIDYSYICVIVDKRSCSSHLDMIHKLSRALSNAIREDYDFFDSFKNVVVYYDNGQGDLTKIITSVFSSHIDSIEFRKIEPLNYKLSQIADLICTTELIAIEDRTMTGSELEFFGSRKRFKTNILKYIRHKRLS